MVKGQQSCIVCINLICLGMLDSDIVESPLLATVYLNLCLFSIYRSVDLVKGVFGHLSTFYAIKI